MTMQPLTRQPVPATCGQCNAPVWSAVIRGWTLLLDPGALTIPAEIAARLAGRTIVQTIPDLPIRELQRRTLDHILTGQPATVLASHICTPPPHPALTPLWPEPSLPSDSEEIPF